MDVDIRSFVDLDSGRYEWKPLKQRLTCSGYVYESAVIDVSRNEEIFSAQEVMELEKKMKRDCQRCVSLRDLVKFAPTASKGMKRALKFIVSHPYEFSRGFSYDSEDSGIYSADRISCFLQWYQLKCTQRSSLINFAADVDIINIERLYELVDQFITEKMAFLITATDMEKKCYDVIIRAGIMPYFGTKDNIRIIDLLLSNLMDEVCLAADISNVETMQVNPLTNWFSHQNFLKILKEYRFCDFGRQGLLRKSDTSRMFGGIFNPFFIEGIFRTVSAYETEADTNGVVHKALDFHLFVTALRSLRYISSVFANEVSVMERSSVRYVFNCLDQDCKGFLDRQDVSIIVYNNIENAKHLNFLDDLDHESVTDEIFDMVHPMKEGRISYEDLITSRQANLVLGIMIDAKQFVEYENREAA